MGALTSGYSLSYRSLFTETKELAQLSSQVQRSLAVAFTNGVLENMCDLCWFDTDTLADSANVEIDLKDLLNEFNEAMAFTKIKLLILENLCATQTLTLGGAAVNPFTAWCGSGTDVVKIPASSNFVLSSAKNGYIVDATHKVLKLANGNAGTTAEYNIWMVGTST